MIPRKDRPAPEELEDYNDPEYDYEPDYSNVLKQRSLFIHDYQRREEEKRERQQSGSEPLPGHETDEPRGRAGFDRDSFDFESVIRHVGPTPQH